MSDQVEMTVWGSSEHDGGPSTAANADGLYKGASRGHAQPRYARLIGMPRGYGFGATMGAWILEDVTFLDGEVLSVDQDDAENPVASAKVAMTTQDGASMAGGIAELRLPRPD